MKNEDKYKTAEERDKAFDAFCEQWDADCEGCPLQKRTSTKCEYEWLTLDAEEEKPLPCPCCSSKSKLYADRESGASWIRCIVCGLSTPTMSSAAKAIAAWNRRVAPKGEAK